MVRPRLINSIGIISVLFTVFFIHSVYGVNSNIDITNKWAWNDLAGWIDFYASGDGANVSSIKMSRWGVFDSDPSTYVALHCTALPPSGTNDCSIDFGVINDGSGNLEGFAWSDEYGWISFCGGQSTANCPGAVPYQVTIDVGNDFKGFAWNDVLGWISFCGGLSTSTCPGSVSYVVHTTWDRISNPTSNNYLESATFDTESDDGFAFNSIYWEGTITPGSTTVGFQLAVSTSTDFSSATFLGSDGTVSTTYSASSSGESIIVDNASDFHPFEPGYRYFRYRVYLDKESSTSPVVTKVAVGWTK
ncbi:MAG: hypothetical protein NUV96_02120 [Candidatus Colwellbacteria bacterium]|nr:hypothetical protein [Candidatus Colwellbacteria bacterium]